MSRYGGEDELVCGHPVEQGEMLDVHVSCAAGGATGIRHSDRGGVVLVESGSRGLVDA